MAIVVTLSPELEALLYDRAAEQGQDVNVVASTSLSSVLEDVLKGILRDAKPSVIPPNPRATRRCARKKRGTGLKVPLFKGDSGGSSLWLLVTGLLKHPLRVARSRRSGGNEGDSARVR
jgi:hypothetical protein